MGWELGFVIIILVKLGKNKDLGKECDHGSELRSRLHRLIISIHEIKQKQYKFSHENKILIKSSFLS